MRTHEPCPTEPANIIAYLCHYLGVRGHSAMVQVLHYTADYDWLAEIEKRKKN